MVGSSHGGYVSMGPATTAGDPWVPYSHPELLSDEVTLDVEADTRYTRMPDWLWHALAWLSPSSTLKVGFEVDLEQAERGYVVGYLPRRGKAMIFNRIQRGQPHYWMQIGGTPCRFFAIDGVTGIPIKIRYFGDPTRDLPAEAVLL